MLEQLQGNLSNIIKRISGQGKITDSNVANIIREIRIALLEADVNLKVAKKFVEHVKNVFSLVSEYLRVPSPSPWVSDVAREL